MTLKFIFIKFYYKIFIWGWGLGIGDWANPQFPNPQSPIPNPQSPIDLKLYERIKFFN